MSKLEENTKWSKVAAQRQKIEKNDQTLAKVDKI